MTGTGKPGVGFPGAKYLELNTKDSVKGFSENCSVSTENLTAKAIAAWCHQCHGHRWIAYGDDVERCPNCNDKNETR